MGQHLEKGKGDNNVIPLRMYYQQVITCMVLHIFIPWMDGLIIIQILIKDIKTFDEKERGNVLSSWVLNVS